METSNFSPNVICTCVPAFVASKKHVRFPSFKRFATEVLRRVKRTCDQDDYYFDGSLVLVAKPIADSLSIWGEMTISSMIP